MMELGSRSSSSITEGQTLGQTQTQNISDPALGFATNDFSNGNKKSDLQSFMSHFEIGDYDDGDRDNDAQNENTRGKDYCSTQPLTQRKSFDDSRQETGLSTRRVKPFIVLIAACAALGGLIFGYDIAGAGATFVMEGFQLHFGWSCANEEAESGNCIPKTVEQIDFDEGLINGLFGIGATVGALINPYFADRFGRRKCVLGSDLMFIFGASVQSFSPTMEVMWIGRYFSGMGVGMLSMVVPVYISETSPEAVRGTMTTLFQLAITFGIVIASAANIELQYWDEGWRLSYGGNIFFAILLIICLIFMPESPRWMAAQGLDDELLGNIMAKLRYEDEVQSEVRKIKKEVEEEQRLGVAAWSELLSSENKIRYRVVLGVTLNIMTQLSGINAIMFYAPDILETFFTPSQAIVGTFALNVINFLSTFITVWAVDKLGRVKLLLSGGLLMMFALIGCSVCAALEQTKSVGWMVLIFCALFIVGFAYSWGPVIWVVCSEMFPLRARGKATGLTTTSNWLSATIIGALFPLASEKNLSLCFAFFSFFIALGVGEIYFFTPETANRTILEIDEAFARHNPRLCRT